MRKTKDEWISFFSSRTRMQIIAFVHLTLQSKAERKIFDDYLPTNLMDVISYAAIIMANAKRPSIQAILAMTALSFEDSKKTASVQEMIRKAISDEYEIPIDDINELKTTSKITRQLHKEELFIPMPKPPPIELQEKRRPQTPAYTSYKYVNHQIETPFKKEKK